jgi:hypothetical protein
MAAAGAACRASVVCSDDVLVSVVKAKDRLLLHAEGGRGSRSWVAMADPVPPEGGELRVRMRTVDKDGGGVSLALTKRSFLGGKGAALAGNDMWLVSLSNTAWDVAEPVSDPAAATSKLVPRRCDARARVHSPRDDDDVMVFRIGLRDGVLTVRACGDDGDTLVGTEVPHGLHFAVGLAPACAVDLLDVTDVAAEIVVWEAAASHVRARVRHAHYCAATSLPAP